MISKAMSDKLTWLLVSIERAGLSELVEENIAFETVGRILATGTSLPNRIKEPVEDTELCAQVMSNPMTWGIAGDEWLNFCEQWATA